MSDNMKQLLKLLLGAGMILVDSGRRGEAVDGIRDRVSDLSDTAKEKYDDLMDRVERVSYAARGKERTSSKVGSFLLGMGVGVGVGMLFAPAAGWETRNNLVDGASNLRDRVNQQATNIRDRVSEQTNNLKEQASNIKEKVRSTVSGEKGPETEGERFSRPA